MQISYVILLYTSHHSIFGEKNMANQKKKSNPIHPENSPLPCGHRKRTVPLLSWIFFSAFFGNFMYIIRGHPRGGDPSGTVSPGTFLLFLRLHAVSNEVGTHGTQKASGIPGRPRPEVGRYPPLPVGCFTGND